MRGRWAPGDRLQPAVLAAEYGASTTVVREALTRLVGQKFVTLAPNHGFFVPRLCANDLRDITLMRCHLESLALKMSIERGDVTWESELIALPRPAVENRASSPRRT
nr:GntR family transcriptional regulator [Pseudonocardia hierapolitana]